MLQQRAQSRAEAAAATAFSASVEPEATEDLSFRWSQPESATSVCTHTRLLPSGNEFQFKIIGKNLDLDKIHKLVPKKIQNWLGI